MIPASMWPLKFLSAFMVGPAPQVEKLPEPEMLDRLWERNAPLFWVVMIILAMVTLIALVVAAWIFLPDSSLAR